MKSPLPNVRSFVVCSVFLVALAACSHPHVAQHHLRTHPSEVQFLDFAPTKDELVQRKQVIKKAVTQLDGRVPAAEGHRFESNPLGYIRSAYWSAGVELLTKPATPGERGLQNLLRSATEKRQIFHGTPRPGDLVLFKKPTAKAQESSEMTKIELGHIAIVENILNDGTLELVARFRRGPARFKLNVQRASTVKTDNGVFINDVVEVGDTYPAGELFHAFVDPWVR